MCVTEFSLTTNITDILASRLRNTGLTGAPFASASGAVAGLLAVQAQDYAAAKWSLGMRVEGSTDVSIENAFNDGAILRTHVLRPTWHFVTPENIRWMLELTAPHVKARMAPYDLKLELDEALLAKTNDAIENSLKSGSPVTRGEIKTALDRIGVATDVQRLAHIVMRAELNGLICSGPRRGKRFTYAPMDGRASKAKRLSREEALSRLALGYFLGHGPAQLADFAWWSGLPVKAAREGLELARNSLEETVIGEKTYWRSPEEKKAPKAPAALLLSIYDEYTIAYRDRSGLGGEGGIERMLKMGNALTAVAVMNGEVSGTWKRTVSKKGIVVEVRPFRAFSPGERKALAAEAARYGRFLGMPAVLEIAGGK
ncbi:MAG: winged helix DNA-binding domain-containing protein [Deltaproteobacteria bacterium]|nr:MAG: winged helix DNA-binding domain-containing protein [Deltaproteobacteria bacterium]